MVEVSEGRVALITPFHKKELFQKYLEAWGDFEGVTPFFIEDSDKKSFKPSELPKGARYYCRKDIRKDLGEASWIISTGCSAIKSYGFLKAYQEGFDYLLVLDDDCYPAPTKRIKRISDLAHSHYLALRSKRGYSNTFHVGEYLYGRGSPWMRGSPLRFRGVRSAVVSVGGWDVNPDLDAITQMIEQSPKMSVYSNGFVNVPKGLGVTMCGMNFMMKREVVPAAYFLLQGPFWGVDRVDDIWAGLFLKKVLDHLELPMAVNSSATITHVRASNVFNSLEQEGVSLLANETLWDRLSTINLEGSNIVDSYESLNNQLSPDWFVNKEVYGSYGKSLLRAMSVWRSFF